MTEHQSPYAYWGIDCSLLERTNELERALKTDGTFARLEAIREHNQMKVLAALQDAGIAESNFGGSTGYGYGDQGRDHLDKAMASIMGAESAIVRVQITTGTQAIAMCLFGVLRPGDEVVSLTGELYDSLHSSIGSADSPDEGSLYNLGVRYREVALTPDGEPDYEAIRSALTPRTKMLMIQRSRGYSDRRAFLEEDIRKICDLVREQREVYKSEDPTCRAADAVIFVDNCYGEFVEMSEPCEWGADLIAGSLMKNPGGGIAPSGGYIAGREDLVELAANRLTAPGLGSEVGPSLGFNRLLTQGLFMGPHVVCETLRGLDLAAACFADRGFKTWPAAGSTRGDIIQSVEFGSPEPMIAFCKAVQNSAPVDAFLTPIPGDMPGYEHQVIMAAGAFVSGASIELSADGPMRAPYMAYMQGGLVYEQVKLAVLLTLQSL